MRRIPLLRCARGAGARHSAYYGPPISLRERKCGARADSFVAQHRRRPLTPANDVYDRLTPKCLMRPARPSTWPTYGDPLLERKSKPGTLSSTTLHVRNAREIVGRCSTASCRRVITSDREESALQEVPASRGQAASERGAGVFGSGRRRDPQCVRMCTRFYASMSCAAIRARCARDKASSWSRTGGRRVQPRSGKQARPSNRHRGGRAEPIRIAAMKAIALHRPELKEMG